MIAYRLLIAARNDRAVDRLRFFGIVFFTVLWGVWYSHR